MEEATANSGVAGDTIDYEGSDGTEQSHASIEFDAIIDTCLLKLNTYLAGLITASLFYYIFVTVPETTPSHRRDPRLKKREKQPNSTEHWKILWA